MTRAARIISARIRGHRVPGGCFVLLMGFLGVALHAVLALFDPRAALAQSLFSAARLQYSTGYQPETVSLGDLNGDGHLDAITAERNLGLLHVYYGRGDGTFFETASLPATQPNVIALADYNVDGHLDIAYASHNGHLIVLGGDGVGGFTQVLDQVIDTRAVAIASGDLNLDGRPDLAIGHWYVITVVLFYPGFHTSTNTYPGGGDDAAIGELTGDGLPDFAMSAGEGVSVYPNLGYNRFGDSSTYYVSHGALGIDIGDLTGDGIPDVATTAWYESAISVLPGDGAGGFGPRQDHEVGYASGGIQVRDVNHDDRADLVVSLGDYYDYRCDCYPWSRVVTLLQQSDGTLAAPLTATTGSEPLDVALGDLDGDGNLDAVTADWYGSTVSVLRGNGDGTFGTPPALALPPGPGGIAAGDVTGDSVDDILLTDMTQSQLSLYPGLPNGSFGPAVSSPCGANPQSVALADLDGDGRVDAVTANTGGGTCSVLYGTGAGFGPSSDYTAVPAAGPIAVADFTGDGLLDIAVGSTGTSWVIGTLWGRAGRDFVAGPTLPLAGGANALVAADLDGDGDVDLATVTSQVLGNDSLATLFANDGTGGFAAPRTIGIGMTPLSLAVADVNHDGRADLIGSRWEKFPEPSRGRVCVLLGQVGGTYQARREFVVEDEPAHVLVADVDADGHPDVVTTNSAANSVSVLRGDGNGGFALEGHYGTGSGPALSTTIDLSHDGTVDLAVLDRAGATVSLLRNRLPALPDSVAPGSEPPAQHILALRVRRSPVRAFALLDYVLGSAQKTAALTIYDVAGRPVRHVPLSASATAGAIRWDLRDDAGRQVASGIYRAELRAGAARQVLSLVLLD